MQVKKSNLNFPNGIRAKPLKCEGLGCSPDPSAVKKYLTVNDFTFYFTSSFI